MENDVLSNVQVFNRIVLRVLDLNFANKNIQISLLLVLIDESKKGFFEFHSSDSNAEELHQMISSGIEDEEEDLEDVPDNLKSYH